MKKVTDIAELLKLAADKRDGGKRILIAVDGRSGSGKTTISEEIGKLTGGTVFHTDDYYLRKEQRTPERLAEPGGNMDRERFASEILVPLSRGDKEITYRIHDCGTLTLSAPISVIPGDTVIIEGSYCCHPALAPYYDVKAFVTVSEKAQRERILEREGSDRAEAFFERWIPMEEKYFAAFGIPEGCDVILDTEGKGEGM